MKSRYDDKYEAEGSSQSWNRLYKGWKFFEKLQTKGQFSSKECSLNTWVRERTGFGDVVRSKRFPVRSKTSDWTHLPWMTSVLSFLMSEVLVFRGIWGPEVGWLHATALEFTKVLWPVVMVHQTRGIQGDHWHELICLWLERIGTGASDLLS